MVRQAVRQMALAQARSAERETVLVLALRSLQFDSSLVCTPCASVLAFNVPNLGVCVVEIDEQKLTPAHYNANMSAAAKWLALQVTRRQFAA